jgi:hypothetical protein
VWHRQPLWHSGTVPQWHSGTVLGNVFCTFERPQWSISDYRVFHTVSTTYRYYYYCNNNNNNNNNNNFKVKRSDQLWSSSRHQNHKRCRVHLHYVVLIAETSISHFIKYMSLCCCELSIMNTK